MESYQVPTGNVSSEILGDGWKLISQLFAVYRHDNAMQRLLLPASDFLDAARRGALDIDLMNRLLKYKAMLLLHFEYFYLI